VAVVKPEEEVKVIEKEQDRSSDEGIGPISNERSEVSDNSQVIKGLS